MKIEITNLKKSFGLINVFSGISFTIDHKELVSIVGPSGCGKTTLLNIISKLDKQDSGSVNILEDSRVGYMMQDTLLLPWRTLAENAVLGTEVINGDNVRTSKLLDYYFNTFELGKYKYSYPESSSGGMKQRVALIRTFLISPSILLLDEPFSNLDFDIKLKVQRHLIKFHLQNEATTLLVTHDIEDAIALSDKVIVLSDKPTSIKSQIPINLDVDRRDPVEARKSAKFREYFIQIWDELKYLNDNDGF